MDSLWYNAEAVANIIIALFKTAHITALRLADGHTFYDIYDNCMNFIITNITFSYYGLKVMCNPNFDDRAVWRNEFLY